MAATTAMSRNSYRALLRFSLHQWRSFSSSLTSSPSFSSRLTSSFYYQPLPFLNTVNLRDQEFKNIGFYRRNLCTSPSSPATTSHNSEVEKPSGAKNSGDGGNSQGSQQTGDAGKSIRGSPVSWMSFFLLLVTGAGIIYYYDNEKKRHIEGRSLCMMMTAWRYWSMMQALGQWVRSGGPWPTSKQPGTTQSMPSLDIKI